MAEILQKKKGLPGSESDSSGDELVPKRLLKKAHRENEVLKKKLEVNQDTIQRLTLVLLDKIGKMPKYSITFTELLLFFRFTLFILIVCMKPESLKYVKQVDIFFL